MILNLYADSPNPDELADQANSSLLRLVDGLNNSLVGEVIKIKVPSGGGTVDLNGSHSLGRPPLVGLLMSDTVGGLNTVTVTQQQYDTWTDAHYTFRLSANGQTVWVLLLAAV